MAVNTNNPPGRLHDILSKAKGRSENSPQAVWAKTFGIPDVQLIALTHRLLDVLELVDQTSDGFSKFPDGQKYMEVIEPIQVVIYNSIGAMRHGVTGLFSPISERHMTLLDLGADEWERQFPAPQVDKKGVAEVRKQTAELKKTVVEATDVDDDLRDLLLSMVTSIERALDRFDVLGPAALEKGVVEVLGKSRWAWTRMERPTEKSSAGQLLKRVGAIIVVMTGLLHFANTAHRTIETFGPDVLLLTSSPEIPPVALPEFDGSHVSSVSSDPLDGGDAGKTERKDFKR